MESNVKEGQEQQKAIQCFECKHWRAVVQESPTPEETYTQILREKNRFGQVLGACVALGKSYYPMFDTEKCALKADNQYLAERI